MSSIDPPQRPVDLTATALASFDLHGLASQLVQQAQYRNEGKAGLALTRDPHLSLVLEVLRKGGELREHRAPSSAMVVLISGRAAFVSEGGANRTEMTPGMLVAFAPELDHSLKALEDSTCLIAIGGRDSRRK